MNVKLEDPAEEALTQAIHRWGERHNWSMPAILAELAGIRNGSPTLRAPQDAGEPLPPLIMPARPGHIGGDYRPHYSKRDADEHFDKLEALLRQRDAEIAGLRTEKHTYEGIVTEAAFGLGLAPDGPDNAWRNARAEELEAQLATSQADTRAECLLQAARALYSIPCESGAFISRHHAEQAILSLGPISELHAAGKAEG